MNASDNTAADRRRLLKATVGAATLMLSGAAPAQAYPSRPIRLVIPLPPGGATDFIGRAIGQRVGTALGQPVVIENKPGANQMIGVMDVVRSAPDGHSLLFAQSSILLNPMVRSDAQYDVVRDLAPVSMVCESFAFFVAPANSPARDFKEFVAWARKQEGVVYGSTGLGSGTHVYGEMINRRAGLKMTHVPYRGEAPVVPDVISGRIQCGFLSGLTALNLAREGKIKLLASIGRTRSPSAPEVPTLGENGMVDLLGWYGLFAPRATPVAIVDRLSAEFDAAIREPDIREKMASASLGPVGGTPRDFEVAVRKTQEGWSQVIQETGVRAD